jgi:hypothetical protein
MVMECSIFAGLFFIMLDYKRNLPIWIAEFIQNYLHKHENNNLNQYNCSIFLPTLERPTINYGVLDNEVKGELLGLIEEEVLLSAL